MWCSRPPITYFTSMVSRVVAVTFPTPPSLCSPTPKRPSTFTRSPTAKEEEEEEEEEESFFFVAFFVAFFVFFVVAFLDAFFFVFFRAFFFLLGVNTHTSSRPPLPPLPPCPPPEREEREEREETPPFMPEDPPSSGAWRARRTVYPLSQGGDSTEVHCLHATSTETEMRPAGTSLKDPKSLSMVNGLLRRVAWTLKSRMWTAGLDTSSTERWRPESHQWSWSSR